jgi:hypothetical protein
MSFPEEEEDRATPSPGVICTQLDEQDAVLVDLDSDRWFVVNETGFRIWRELKVGRSFREIARLLVAEYDVTPADARAAVSRMVDSLRAQGLLLPAGSAARR